MKTSRRNSRGESTLRAILSETAMLVSRYGYDATTISRISKSTGKPASSLYWFFETKDELIAASLESTYKNSPAKIAKWQPYRESSCLRTQLEEIMIEQLHGSSSEQPVRLGLMVALEGSAFNKVVQKPFSSRRQTVRTSLEEWWLNVAEQLNVVEAEHVASQMMLLTVAFLDGHYISDTSLDSENLQQKAAFAAACLDRAFAELSKNTMTVIRGTHSAGPEAMGQEPDNHDVLLSTTRQLVSERGYEGATLARICENSRVQRSSVYWRYSDKDKLIEAAVAGPFLEIMSLDLPEQCASVQQAAACLAQSLVDGATAGMQNREAVRAGLLMKLQHRQPPSAASARIQEALAEQESALAEWLMASAGLPADHAAAAAWGNTVVAEGTMLAIAFGQFQNIPALFSVSRAMLESALEPTEATMEH